VITGLGVEKVSQGNGYVAAHLRMNADDADQPALDENLEQWLVKISIRLI
jgi:hypothetical protein